MDWKDIKPLTEREARLIVSRYLSNHGFASEEIDIDSLSKGKKSPDFCVYKNAKLIFHCEVKTPEHKLNSVTNMYHWDTTFYKLRKFIHKAKKQFQDYDPEHKYPWVIAFTSNHPQLHWKSFLDNIVGAVAFNGKVLKDFRGKSFIDDSNKDLLSIDLFLWFQVNYLNRKGIAQLRHFVNKDSRLFGTTENISQSLKPFEGEVANK